MNIYVAHSSSFDFKNELYAPLKESELNTKHSLFLPHETDEFVNTKEIIKNSDVVIAEVSYPSTGEGIELGWADDARVKVLCIYKEGSKITDSLKAISNTFIPYKDVSDMVKKIIEKLSSD